jgi:glutamate-1-semialdehyde 2,1-aminomutase
MACTTEYLREARRLTERHGALLICDEIITGFRFRAGDLSSMHGVRPDLLVLGKVVGGGMPVAAVAGRREVMELCCRGTHRVKFEGGTYSAHELSLVAARAMLVEVTEREAEIYPALAKTGAVLRDVLAAAARDAGVPVAVLGSIPDLECGSSLAFLHVLADGPREIRCPEELAQHQHPRVGERLLKSVLMLENLSVRSGLGAASTTHGPAEIEVTVTGYRAAFERLRQGEVL